MILASVLILRCDLTNDPVSGSFLHRADGLAAWGSSELLNLVDDPLGDQFGYGPPMSRSVPRKQLPDPAWRTVCEIRLRLLEQAFHAG